MSSSNPKIKSWKDFLITNPWASVSLLEDVYGVKPYDLSNWKKANPGVANFIDEERPRWLLAQLEDPDLIRRSLKAQMKYYVEEVLGIDVELESASEMLRTIKQPQKPWGRLVQKKYLEKLPEFAAYRAEGYTNVTFLVHAIYPGKTWCNENGLLKQNFPQRRNKKIDFLDAVQMLKDIYFSQISDVEDRESAIRIFLIRKTEQSFFRIEDFTSKGVSSRVFSAFSKHALVERISEDFATELGGTAGLSVSSVSWSSAKFRKMVGQELESCRYCKRSPVDLHHLIERRTDPSLAYHEENVVPLCTQAHALISRDALSAKAKELYNEARIAWRKAPSGQKISCFDEALEVIHDEAYMND